MNERNRPNTAMAAALTEAAAALTTPDTTNAPETVQAAVAAAVVPTSADDFINEQASPVDLAANLTNGLTLDQLFTAVVFLPTPQKSTYDQTDRTGNITGKSRKVADVRVQLAGSGLFVTGAISLIQKINEKNAAYRFSWHYSFDSRSSCFEFGGPTKETTREEMEAWKDKTILAFHTWVKDNGLNLVGGTVEQRHAVEGVSLI